MLHPPSEETPHPRFHADQKSRQSAHPDRQSPENAAPFPPPDEGYCERPSLHAAQEKLHPPATPPEAPQASAPQNDQKPPPHSSCAKFRPRHRSAKSARSIPCHHIHLPSSQIRAHNCSNSSHVCRSAAFPDDTNPQSSNRLPDKKCRSHEKT